MRMSRPRCCMMGKFALKGLTVGQIETINLTPISSNSRTIPAGSGQNPGSKRQSPCSVQWKKSMTITASGRPRRLYSRATERSSSWVR